MHLLLEGSQLDGHHVDLGGQPGILNGVMKGIIGPSLEAEVLEGLVEVPEPPVACPLADLLRTAICAESSSSDHI